MFLTKLLGCNNKKTILSSVQTTSNQVVDSSDSEHEQFQLANPIPEEALAIADRSRAVSARGNSIRELAPK